ncbi:MAG: hypothetical protein ACRERC_15255 [Candidatus Binatia bacterium]
MTWLEWYADERQALWGLIVVPALFIVYRLVRGRAAGGVLPAAAGFVDRYALVFAVATIIDPLATVWLVRRLDIADGAAGTAVMLAFVLLGDFRVYLLLFGLVAIAAGRAWTSAVGTALGWTLVVPLAAYVLNNLAHALLDGLGDNSIWLIYELLFAAVALGLVLYLLPRLAHRPLRGYLRALLLYVAAYYALWAASDVLIQVAGLDIGWALRALPNQLYYAFWVPLVYFAFFAPRYVAASASTHASR